MAHDHGKDGCQEDAHEHESSELGVRYSLYTQIDINNVQCLNEVEDDSGKSVFKPWEDRFSCACVESDVDPELLINIPFVSNVKLKGIIVMGGSGNVHPSKMRLFKNRDYLSFDDVEAPADLEFELQHDLNGILEYPIPVVKFSSLTNLAIHFPTNFGDDKTVIYYIGLRGEFTPMQRQSIVLATYETRPQLKDHMLRRIEGVPEIL